MYEIPATIEQRIQLKKAELKEYTIKSKLTTQTSFDDPRLQMIKNELRILENELEDSNKLRSGYRRVNNYKKGKK